jgi:phosphoserine phosphatase
MKKEKWLRIILFTVMLSTLAIITVPVFDIYAETESTAASKVSYKKVELFPQEVNERLEKFFKDNSGHEGRKVAIFDCDGTLFGQVPNYLADESLYGYAAAHPERKPDIIKEMTTKSNVGSQYVEDRIKYLSGLSVEAVENIGDACFKKYYRNKFYPQMQGLIDNLRNNGFEIWVITASPEVVYQKFVSDQTGVPINRILGVKSVIKGSIVTDEMVLPIPQDIGKEYVIDTFIKVRPLLAAGNSRGDFEMIQTSTDLKMIVNPDKTKSKDVFGGLTLEQFAKKNNWLIVGCVDVPTPNFPGITTKKFGMKENVSHP